MKTALITGASTGIGKATAMLLSESGWHVFAGVRTREAAENLTRESNDRIQPLLLDVTHDNQIQEAGLAVAAQVGDRGLDALVNNAGIAVGGPLEFVPIERLRLQLEVNVIGQVAVTQTFLPLLRIASGRIVNMGSVSGQIAMPMVGPYAMSKFALEAFTDSLRRELAGSGVEVSIIEPGVIDTPIWDKARETAKERRKLMSGDAEKYYGDSVDSVDDWIDNAVKRATPVRVVAELVRSILESKSPRTRYPVGKDARWVARIARWLSDRRIDAFVARKH